MTDLKYGDMICYKTWDASAYHDGPVMFIGNCPNDKTTIEILAIPEGTIEHKDPEVWQVCTHLPVPSA